MKQKEWYNSICLVVLNLTLPEYKMTETKTWVVTLEIEIDANSHPRKFVPDAISECLNLEEGEDIIDYKFVCLD